jgi:hypothetical protein
MTETWSKFFLQQTIKASDDIIFQYERLFPKLSALSETIVVPIDSIGVLRVSGPDAEEFLQAQLTSDISDILPNSSAIGGYCNPKGRLLAVFMIFREKDDYLLISDSEGLPKVMKTLSMYILRMKVNLAIDTSFIPIGFIGGELDEIMCKLRKTATATSDVINSIKEPYVSFVWPNHPGLLVLLPEFCVKTVWPIIAKHAKIGPPRHWDLFEIRAGIPRITLGTTTSFIPQSVNLDQINGVSFTKGCYPGQEIVARVRYLGRLKHRMGRATFSDDSIPKPGDPVFSDISRTHRTGSIVNAAGFSSSKGGELLLTIPVQTSIDTVFYLNNTDRIIQLVANTEESKNS